MGSLSLLAAETAGASARTIRIAYRYPTSGSYAGIALYSATSEADLAGGPSLVRIDLGMQPVDSQGLVTVSVPGFDSATDYFLALRSYDAAGRESQNSMVGIVRGSKAILYHDDFESYAPGTDPPDWVDSGPGQLGPGGAALFETAQLPGGGMAYAAAASSAEIHSHLDAAGAGSWSSYKLSGRLESDALVGGIGVTVLSQYPESQFYYRLSRAGDGAFGLDKRGGSSGLRCAGTASTGVTSAAGQWLRFAVLATRFADRNRLRASVWPDGSLQPAAWQVDCWDAAGESEASGRIGVYSLGSAGNHWDDLLVFVVVPDGAPQGYDPTPVTNVPPPPPPPPPPVNPPPVSSPPSASYTSASALEHWWVPGWDVFELGHDFATGAGLVDAATAERGITAKDVTQAGSSSAQVDFNGANEALGNSQLRPYGIGNTWSISAWLRPTKLPGKNKLRYAFDLNGMLAKQSASRISLVLDPAGHFGVVVSDAAGAERAIASSSTVDRAHLGSAWYHVVAVKTGTSALALYVNGVLAASTSVGVPAQTDVPRAMRIGCRVKVGTGTFWSGGIGAIGVWHSALAGSEVKALYAGGNRTAAALR